MPLLFLTKPEHLQLRASDRTVCILPSALREPFHGMAHVHVAIREKRANEPTTRINRKGTP